MHQSLRENFATKDEITAIQEQLSTFDRLLAVVRAQRNRS